MFISFYRIIKFAIQDIRRNVWLSTVTTVVLVLTLISVNSLLALNFLMKEAANSLEGKVDVSLYFKSDVSVERVRELRSLINKVSGIVSAKIIEPEEAVASFKDRYENDKTVLEALQILEKNPFGPTLIVKAESPEVYKNVLLIVSDPANKKLIADQNFDDRALLVEKISRLTRKMNQFGIIASALFGLIAVMIAMTTIRVAIYTHRETIGIMKLVGASNWFVRFPYLVQGVVISLISLGITMILVYALVGVVETRLVNVFGSGTLELSKYFYNNFWTILGTELGATVVLNLFITNFAVGRYLKV